MDISARQVFFIVLSIRGIYIDKLFSIEEHDKDKLRKLNIDFFEDDFCTISLKGTTGDIWYIFDLKTIPFSMNEKLW